MRASLLAVCLCSFPAIAQQAQNPSPMVEHTRVHPRLTEQTPRGTRHPLELGTLFLPPGVKRGVPILFFFHGASWIPEVAAVRNRIAVVSVNGGTGSSSYVRLFEDPGRFLRLLHEAEEFTGGKFTRVMVGGWSAGCGALRQILKDPASYARINSVLAIDGIHSDYLNGHSGPLESEVAPDNLEIWLKLARDAMRRQKRVLIIHSEIFPGTYASTTETADFMISTLKLKARPVLKWGPMGTQQLGEAIAGNLRILAFAGNSAPDHVDLLQSLPAWLRTLK